MRDMNDAYAFFEDSLAYLDGPQEGYVQERATGSWYRFRCLRAAHETWVWLLDSIMDSMVTSMKDLTDGYDFFEESLGYLDGPQEGYVQEKATLRWYRFRCLRAADQVWVWLLIEVPGPAPVLDVALFEHGDWRGARVYVEHKRGKDSTLEEYDCRLPIAP